MIHVVRGVDAVQDSNRLFKGCRGCRVFTELIELMVFFLMRAMIVHRTIDRNEKRNTVQAVQKDLEEGVTLRND